MDKAIKDANLGDSYKIIAPCDNVNNGEGLYSRLVEYTLRDTTYADYSWLAENDRPATALLKDTVDIIGSHDQYYNPVRTDKADNEADKNTDFKNDYYYTELPAERLKNVVNAAKAAGKEQWVDETNAAVKGIGVADPYRGTALGAMVTAYMNMGCSNAFIWTLNDQQWPNSATYNDDGFENGLQRWGYAPSLFESYTPYKSWYALSLITKYMGSGAVYSTSDNAADHIYSSFVKQGDDVSLLAVNYNNATKKVKFNFGASLNGKTLYKYAYNPETVAPTSDANMIGISAKAEEVSTALYDTLNPYEVVIYTTQKPIENGAEMNISDPVGTSIRLNEENEANGENRSGLRFKANVKNEMLETYAINGYTLVEYGTVVMRSDILGEYNLKLDTEVTVGNKTYKSAKGVAYSLDEKKDIIFKRFDDSRDFTAVLYNIGYNKTTGAINYDLYGVRYATRTYARLKYGDTGEVVTVYDDDIQLGSIFDVFYAVQMIEVSKITDSEKKTEALEDKTKVKKWLGQNNEIVTAYNEWKKEMGYIDVELDVGAL